MSIKSGDFVRVYFDQCPIISYARVIYTPPAPGDLWHLVGAKTEYVVKQFSYMEKLTKKEVELIKNPPPLPILKWDE